MLERESISSFLALSLPFKKQIGSVHSVFKTSLNVIIGDQLINISKLGMPLSSFGCLTDHTKIDTLVTDCLPGDMVKVQDMTLFFYTKNGIFRLDLSHFEEIDLSLQNLKIPKAAVCHTAVYNCLKDSSLKESIGLENNPDAEDHFNRLKAVSSQSETQIREDIAYFIGRGKGLTPSGDDILSGFTMIRKIFNASQPFEEMLEQTLSHCRTTDISTAYYTALLSGYVSSLFISFINSLESDDSDHIRLLIATIKKYGHTSGHDTLFGMYLGLESLIHDLEE